MQPMLRYAIDSINKFTNPNISRDESNYQRLIFEDLIASYYDTPFDSSDRFRKLIVAYLDLPPSDFESIQPLAHIWFLEHLDTDELPLNRNYFSNLVDLYQNTKHPLIKHHIVEIILSMDEPNFVLNLLVQRLAKLEIITADQRTSSVQELLRIMLDYVTLRKNTIKMVQILLQSLPLDDDGSNKIYKRMLVRRGEQLKGSYERRLKSIAENPHKEFAEDDDFESDL